MKNILLLIILGSCALVIISIFAINLWLQMSDVTISYNGKIAIFLGAFFTILLGSGLMSLAFFSSRHGFDEQVDHNLEDLFKKLKDR
jgi:hypothetical protein